MKSKLHTIVLYSYYILSYYFFLDIYSSFFYYQIVHRIYLGFRNFPKEVVNFLWDFF